MRGRLEVQAAINAARSQLPTSLPSNPTYRKVNPLKVPTTTSLPLTPTCFLHAGVLFIWRPLCVTTNSKQAKPGTYVVTEPVTEQDLLRIANQIARKRLS